MYLHFFSQPNSRTAQLHFESLCPKTEASVMEGLSCKRLRPKMITFRFGFRTLWRASLNSPECRAWHVIRLWELVVRLVQKFLVCPNSFFLKVCVLQVLCLHISAYVRKQVRICMRIYCMPVQELLSVCGAKGSPANDLGL